MSLRRTGNNRARNRRAGASDAGSSGIAIATTSTVGPLLACSTRTDGVYTGTATPDFIRPINQAYATTAGPVTNAAASVANRFRATLFYVNRPGTLAALVNKWNGGSGSWQWGIYGLTAGSVFPGSLVWDSGAKTYGAATRFTLTVGIAFSVGWYALGGACSDTTSSVFQINGGAVADVGVEADYNGVGAGSPSFRSGWYFAHTVGNALPSTFPTTAIAEFHSGTQYPTLFGRWT